RTKSLSTTMVYNRHLLRQRVFTAQPRRCLGKPLGFHQSRTDQSGVARPQFLPVENTGATAYTSAPIWLGEFGTGTTTKDINSTGAGSQGQWFSDMVNFVNSSYTLTAANNPGFSMQPLNWTYWSINGNDSFAILNSNWNGLILPAKVY